MLKGEKIYLKSIEKKDLELIINWRNKDFIKKYFIFRKPFTMESQIDWYNNVIKKNKAYQFIIYLKKEDKPIGSVFLKDIDFKNKKGEFGIFIGEQEYQAQGYGKEAAKLIMEFGFEILKLNKIFLRVLANNQHAIKSYQETGFIREALLKQDVIVDGIPLDIILMAKLKSEFKN